MAAQIENANFVKIVGYPENYCVASKAAQNDTLLFNDPMVFIENMYLDAAGVETFVHNALTVASLTDTDTTVTYSGGATAPRLEGDYFIKVEHEFIMVKGDTDNTAATGTLTLVRGVLGSTVASHDAGSAYIQNSVKLTSVNTGDVKILYKSVPAFRDGLNMTTESNRVWSSVNPNRIYGSDYTEPTG